MDTKLEAANLAQLQVRDRKQGGAEVYVAMLVEKENELSFRVSPFSFSDPVLLGYYIHLDPKPDPI